MNNSSQPSEQPFLLKLDGKMTYPNYPELEEKITAAIQRHKFLEIDLSEVSEIDLCGLHLVGLLQSAGVIVASSPIVEQASKNLFSTLSAAALGRAARSDRMARTHVNEVRTG
ncbi:STAS domain-containing protein [Propionivibrio sp.]|uniref:STAS domain-containing protein n=1 Tax=Propionivibrio sp. TaxID=2212460 RepID=UPI003BF29378